MIITKTETHNISLSSGKSYSSIIAMRLSDIEKHQDLLTHMIYSTYDDESLFGSDRKMFYLQHMANSCFDLYLQCDDYCEPLENLVLEAMDKLMSKTDLDLVWLSIVHGKDNNPHCHIVINGNDRSGKEIHENVGLILSHILDNIIRASMESFIKEGVNTKIVYETKENNLSQLHKSITNKKKFLSGINVEIAKEDYPTEEVYS